MNAPFAPRLLRLLAPLVAAAIAGPMPGADNKDAAGIAAGVSLLAPALAAGATRSSMDVTIEAYVPDGNLKLGGPSALYQVTRSGGANLSSGDAARMHLSLTTDLPKLRAGAARAQTAAQKVAGYVQTAQTKRVIALYGDREKWLNQVIAAGDAFEKYYTAHASKFTSADLAKLADLGRDISLIAGNTQSAAYPSGITDLLALELDSQYPGARAATPPPQPDERARLGEFLGVNLPPLIVPANTPNAVQLFAALGFDITAADLTLLQSTPGKDLALALLDTKSPIERAVAKANELSLVFSAITSSAIFGPLVNEGIQQIFGGDHSIMEALKPANAHRWHELNLGKSAGAAGDFNMIVYFENVLTPMIKKTTFDPTEFQAAAASLYKSSMATVASLYGLPGTDPAQPASPYNVQALNLRQQALNGARTDWRDQQLDALKRLIDRYEQTKAAHVTPPAAAGGTATWKTAAVVSAASVDQTAALQEIKDLLTSLSSRLNPPTP